ncbi:helix-turn-helix domain-containing protein [Shinella sp.]|uniref:helix-turn-helix domain-containing protein n=2 Tax=Shinella sp. TaxID=1870904 RepID=UPI004035C70D
MSTHPTTDNLARASYGTFVNPEAMASAIGGMYSGGASPRPAGRSGKLFHGTLARVSFDRLSVGAGRFAQGIAQTAGAPNLHTFMFATEPGIVRRVSGRSLYGRHIFHFRPNERIVTSSPAGQPWAFGIVTVPFERLAAYGSEVTGRDHGVPLDDDRMFVAPEAGMASLVALMVDMARLARDTPWVITEPQPARALSGTILDVLVGSLTQGVVRRDRAALGRHRQIVTRFKQAMDDRPEEMLSLRDICVEVGVAQRTLSLACQEFLGQGPMQFARDCRLDHVRDRLLAGDPATTSVTTVAMQLGFWELGRFAIAYRRRFGERPSDTLRRNGS